MFSLLNRWMMLVVKSKLQALRSAIDARRPKPVVYDEEREKVNKDLNQVRSELMELESEVMGRGH